MRILHTNMLRGWGGQSNRILTEALGTMESGHAVAFAVPEKSALAAKGVEAGIELMPGYAMKPPFQLWHSVPDLRRFLRDVRRWKPDLIHLHGSQDTWLAVLAKQFLGRECPPIIRTKHNMFTWHPHPANRWMYRQLDATISISNFIDRQIAEFPGLGDKPRTCIFSVPDLSRLEGDHPSIRGELPNAGEGMFLWGTTGRMRWEKGFDNLLRAFAIVRRERPDAFLVLAGAGSLLGHLQVDAQSLGLGPDAVRFLGFREDIAAILKSLDAYVLSSRSEGLGTAILEALAVGLPVVATDVGGIPDSVRHERTGLLVPPDQPDALAAAMLRLMQDADLRRRLGEGAAAMVREEFAVENLLRQTIDFYHRVIDSKK